MQVLEDTSCPHDGSFHKMEPFDLCSMHIMWCAEEPWFFHDQENLASDSSKCPTNHMFISADPSEV